VFEANTAGEVPYTVGQRLFCLVVKFGEYSLAGIVCGFVGHAMAEGLMRAKYPPSPPPPPPICLWSDPSTAPPFL